MNINFSNIGYKDFLNVHRMNQSIARQNGSSTPSPSLKAEHRDNVSISNQGKIIESLMKQKGRIAEQKSLLISRTLENGGSLEDIKSQLKDFDYQSKTIDQQIAEIMAKEMERKKEKMKPQEENQPKSEEEIQNERFTSITSLSSDLQQAKTINSVKVRMDGESRVLKSEIEIDKGRGLSVNEKEAKLVDMEQKSLHLASKIADSLADISKRATNDSVLQKVVLKKEDENLDNKWDITEGSMVENINGAILDNSAKDVQIKE